MLIISDLIDTVAVSTTLPRLAKPFLTGELTINLRAGDPLSTG